MANDPLLDPAMGPDHVDFWVEVAEAAESLSIAVHQGDHERTTRKITGLAVAFAQLAAIGRLAAAMPAGTVLCADDEEDDEDAPSGLVECSRCGTQRILSPVPGKPGFVSLSEIEDGWTFPPALCPSCSAPKL